MEKTKLNLSVPLISVRRINSGIRQSEGVNRKNVENPQPNRQQPLCVPKSDFDLSEVMKPVAVPFCWEQAPGKRRGENGGKVYPCEDPSTMPRLPPGRKPESRRFYSCERPGHQDSFRFQTEALAEKDHAALMDSLVESMHAKGEFDVEGRDCTYPDVLETVTAIESLSLNCSISDLSGCQGLDVEVGRDVKSSRVISADSHSRDFMMSRFLPAAKAAVLENPQFAPKKDLLVTEQPQLVKDTVTVERKPLAKKYEPYIMSYYSDYAEDVVTEEDEANDKMTADQHKRSRKFWKLFPRLSVKSSLGLLNSFPGMKSKSQAPTSSMNEVKRLTRNAPSGPLNKARKAYSGPIEKVAASTSFTCTMLINHYEFLLKFPLSVQQSYDAIYKQRFRSGALSGELCKADKRSLSNQLSCSADLFKADGDYPHRGSRSGAISPYRNFTTSSRFNEGTGFLGVPREVENLKGSMFSSFREVDDHLWETPMQSACRGESDSPCDVVEKTVYVDSVNYVKTTTLDLSSSKPKGVMDSVENLMTTASRIVEQTSAAKACSSNIRTQSALDLGKRLTPEELKDLSERTSSYLNQEPNQKQGSREFPVVHHNGNTNTSSLENFKPDNRSYSDVTSSLSPYPPLPKSPSESWLWRTLPSRNHNDQINQSPRAANTTTKREIAVKSCSEHHSNSYYAEVTSYFLTL